MLANHARKKTSVVEPEREPQGTETFGRSIYMKFRLRLPVTLKKYIKSKFILNRIKES